MVRRQPPRRQRRPPENDGWEPPQQPDEPLPGLVPIGGGFYATSDEPVSPFDCTRWTDSPYCGGNPFTFDFVDFGFSRIQDECNIGIQFAPSFGFIKLPIHQFVYRKPGECRLPPPPPEPPINQAPACKPLEISGSATNNSLAIAFRNKYFYYNEIGTEDWELATFDAEITRVKFLDKNYFATVIFSVRWSYKNTAEKIDKNNIEFIEYGVINSGFFFGMVPIKPQSTGDTQVLCLAAYGLEAINALPTIGDDFDWVYCFEDYDLGLWSVYDYLLPVPGEPPTINFSSPIRSFTVEPNPPQGTFYGIQWVYEWEALLIENRQTVIKIFETDFDKIPPPPPKDCECMCRCNNDSNNDQLLRLILKRIGPLPAAVPNSLVKKNSGT
ncbi:hypothetical protein LC593_37085, partial [Nostoc sp. CHAB 5844]|nr:hypothetical protein [Nostoc sp. CHAB 5844]